MIGLGVLAEFLRLHAIVLLHWALDVNQLAAYGSLFHCSEQKQVQNDDSTAVILPAVALSQAAKTLSFLVHFVYIFECQQ